MTWRRLLLLGALSLIVWIGLVLYVIDALGN